MKIDLCGLDSCHDEYEDDNESYSGAKHKPPVGGHLRAFMACRKKEHRLCLQQQVKETGTGSTDEVVYKVQCSRHSSSEDRNSSSSYSHQNNTNNLTSKQFSQEKEVDLERQVQSGSDLKFKRIPSKRNQSDEQGQKHIKQQHNFAVQSKSPPISRKSVQKPRDFDERAYTSVEGGEAHMEDSTKGRARASMTSNVNGLQDEAENNGNSGASFFQSVLRCGASSTAAVPHNLMKPRSCSIRSPR